jgi:DNA-binding transcriptional LysR family regulator
VSAVPDFVRAGLGIGLGLAFAPLVPHPDLRIVPLPRFKPLQVMVLSHRDPGPDTRAFIEEIEHVSRQPANLADGCGSRPRSQGS